jgi:thymidylate synthase
MIKLKPIYIEAVDIPDAWFQCIYNLGEYGFKYTVEQGSFVGETRLEYDWALIYISHPYQEPYDKMLPKCPPSLGIPDPVAQGYIEQYIPYIMTEYKEPNAYYTYGSRIWPQVEPMIKLLRDTPRTNQAVLRVSEPDDYKLSDPPCLQIIDLRIRDNTLISYPVFRSWDLWAAFAANLAVISILQKYIADEVGVESGPMLASSKGLHVYGYAEELMRLRTYKRGV